MSQERPLPHLGLSRFSAAAGPATIPNSKTVISNKVLSSIGASPRLRDEVRPTGVTQGFRIRNSAGETEPERRRQPWRERRSQRPNCRMSNWSTTSCGAPRVRSDAFYHRHSRLIYHCIRSRTGGQDVDDIFQAFFERLLKSGFRALQLWQRGSSLPVYLSSVIRNFVTDFHRSKRMRGGRRRHDGAGAAPGAEAETITATTHLKELRHIGIRAWAVLEAGIAGWSATGCIATSTTRPSPTG